MAEKFAPYAILAAVVALLGYGVIQKPTVVNIIPPQSQSETLGAGTSHTYGAYDAAQGYYVNGTQVINSSGQFVSAFNGTTIAASGATALSGDFNYLEGYSLVHNTAATLSTTTITAADSGTTYYLTSSGTTNFVLPATSTAAGTHYKFYVDGALASDAHIYTAGYSNVIEGSMIVAGAVVDCDAEDTITFVSDGENVGDFIDLRSNGMNWLIGASGALTSSKMTCTTTT